MSSAKYLLAALLILFGAGFALAPDTWIESQFGFSPDGGDGWLEAVIAAAPICLGAWLALRTYRTARAASIGRSV